jgi:hypothetical protein
MPALTFLSVIEARCRQKPRVIERQICSTLELERPKMILGEET